MQNDRARNPLSADSNARQSSYGWTSLHDEIADLKAERDYLQAEQAKLLAIIQNDNAKLVEILQEVQASKAKFLAKIDTLEKERAKLKAFSAEVIETNIEGLLSNMPLSDILKRADATPELQPAHTVSFCSYELNDELQLSFYIHHRVHSCGPNWWSSCLRSARSRAMFCSPY
jgi:DNA repair exonuclease SbcCD ATPase subunit